MSGWTFSAATPHPPSRCDVGVTRELSDSAGERDPAVSGTARRVRVTGLVQGVGFRPFVHRLALRHGVTGWVLNASGAVEIHAEGAIALVDAFIAGLRAEAPVLARIEALDVSPAEALGVDTFEVRASAASPDGRLPVSPDVATCDACARELADPSNRRFRYPFITCTDCGPRFTVIESMPYDRERTSMRAFAQCPACLAEYTTPGDRRYHSETNSCPTCGPSLWFERRDDQRSPTFGEGAMRSAAQLLREGGILAVRGLGGFHLAVDATSRTAVDRLRSRKGREAKPLAVMVGALDAVREFAQVNPAEAGLLESAARPVVLLATRTGRGDDRDRDGGPPLAPNVAPGLAHVGVMLAYTPLHQLLLRAAGRPLVMTSGNLSDEPIAIANDEARQRLRDIADGFLLHDREIVARYDDSVMRVVDGAPVFLRRARGYAPMPIDLPIASPRPLLAVGPHLKNTFTLLEGSRAYVSQHIGDLETVETVEHFSVALRRFEQLFRIRPQAVVRDLHPGYLSTRLARETGLEPDMPVQHHHAHIAAVMAEHGRTDPVIGIAFDGTGYGDDGHVWGAEVLHADLVGYRRLGHLRYAPLPGGDAAARAPWRAALGYLSLDPAGSAIASGLIGVSPRSREVAVRQIERRLNAPLASSMGRLFDAAAAVIGVRYESRYEGQAAMELEALAGARQAQPLPWRLTTNAEGMDELDPIPLLVALGERARFGVSKPELAAAFHETVTAATIAMVQRAADRTGCRTVALAGGCFQNARLLSSLSRRLKEMEFEVLVPVQLGPNDGAVSFGQAAVGAAQLAGVECRVATTLRA